MRYAALIACLLLCSAALLRAELTRAIDIRTLPVERAMAGEAVLIQGTVGFVETPGTVFIQDATAGTFFRNKAGHGGLRVGDEVEVSGVTVPGLYLTGIEASSYRVLGAGPAPAPQTASYDDLATGRYHYQRVLVEGVGRRVTALEENRSLLFIALGGRVLEVRVDAPPTNAPSGVDARLRIVGLAAGGINDRRQLVFPYLRVSSWDDVIVIQPAPAVQSLALLPAASLLRFGSAVEAAHRVRVRGRVLASFSDGRVFVRDTLPTPPAAETPETAKAPPLLGPTALAIRLSVPAVLSSGQVVEFAGFPSMEDFSASLADAEVLPLDKAVVIEPAMPVEVTPKALLSGVHDADLVTLSATLVDTFRSASGTEWRLQADATPLTFFLPSSAGGSTLTEIPRGSRVQVAGICRVESSSDKGFRSRPEQASLLLRSADDLRVLSAPSWWTPRRLLAATGVLAALILLAAIWITLLRRQVAKQGLTLRQSIAHEAALEERQRLAREFHDTLEQELAGLSIRLGAASTRPLEDKARSLLETSQHLVSRIQTEARNLVADLRSAPDASVDLAVALQELVARWPGADAQPAVRLDVPHPLPALPAHVAHHLRMIAQEALTNAVKHAQASRIDVRVVVEGSALQMTISDDGRGFDPSTETHGKSGHFGCMGIRERCRKIAAEAGWHSTPGAGTRIAISLSL